MQLLTLILKKVEFTEELIGNLYEAGISGGTIIDSKGMAKTLADMEDVPLFGMLRRITEDDDREDVKTLMFVLKDEDIEKTKKIIKDTVGDLKKPNTGILFTVPLSSVEGIGEAN